MIKNIVFDLGRVLIEFNPTEYLRSFGFDEKTNTMLSNIIFKSEDWIKCDRGEYTNNSDLNRILEIMNLNDYVLIWIF